MTTQTQKMSAKTFLALPVSNLPHELLHGEEMMSLSPSKNHQRVSFRLAKLIERLIPNGEVFYAPVDVYFDDENIVQTDVLWVAEDSLCTWVEDKYLQG